MKHYFLIFFLALASIASAQVPVKPKTLLSPIATSLGVYGEVPVSCFTGTPSIEVPLYELKTSYLNIPLTLNYHTSLVRPDLIPGPAGLGWAFNASGVISRTVNDIPDDYKKVRNSKRGYYHNHSFMDSDDWNTENGILGMLYYKVYNDIYPEMDTEPDEFTFNFLDYHGKFLLNHKGEWVVQCDKPVKVEFDGTFLAVPFSKKHADLEMAAEGYFSSFSGFTLTTADGTRYIFGKHKESIDYSIDFFFQSSDDWIATSWYLTKIIMPNNEEIAFSYIRGAFSNQMVWAYYYSIASYSSEMTFRCSNGAIDENLYYQGKLMSSVRLKEIRYSNIVIEIQYTPRNDLRYKQDIYNRYCLSHQDTNKNLIFLAYDNDAVASPTPYPKCLNKMFLYYLNSISVYVDGTDRKKTPDYMMEFYYNEQDGKERLMLQKIDIMREGVKWYTDLPVDRCYKFEYNPGLTTDYLSREVDHWGYYNGRKATFANYGSYYSLRNPVSEKLQCGVLKKIIYPTGGYTRFVFEPHSYRKNLTSDRLMVCKDLESNNVAGGLRIKQIINSPDSLNETVTKEYFYVSDYLTNGINANTSSGVLGGSIKYYFPSYNVKTYPTGGVATLELFSSQSVLPCCENTTGCHIGYSSVVEKNADNSFVIYRYSNFDNGTPDSPASFVLAGDYTPHEPYNSRSMERGHLLYEDIYNATRQKTSSRSITYQRSSDESVRLVRAYCNKACPNEKAKYYIGVAYQAYMHNMRVASETEQHYEGSNSTSFTTTYAYDSYGQLKNTSQTVTGGKKVVNYKYAYESNPTMKERHVLSPVSEVVEGFTPTGKTFQQHKQTRYNYIARPEVSDYCFPLSSILEEGRTNSLRTVYGCHEYDSKGNPTYVTRNGELDIVYIWDATGRYLTAEILNANFGEVEAALKTVTGTSDFERANGLRSKLPQAQISTFDIHPLFGIMAEVDPQGQRTEYRYDPRYRLESEWDTDGHLVRKYDYRCASKYMTRIEPVFVTP